MQSLRNIGLTDALVSLFALQTTLIALYSEGEGDMTALNIAVGAIVCAATIGMGVFMIVRAGVLLKSAVSSPRARKRAPNARKRPSGLLRRIMMKTRRFKADRRYCKWRKRKRGRNFRTHILHPRSENAEK